MRYYATSVAYHLWHAKALMVTSPVMSVVFLKSLALDFSVVINVWADTREISPSVHNDRDAQHAVPKEFGPGTNTYVTKTTDGEE
jgi:hypothetical protein